MNGAHGRTDTIRSVGLALTFVPIGLLALVMSETTPKALVVALVGFSVTGLVITLWAQLLMEGEERMGIRERGR